VGIGPGVAAGAVGIGLEVVGIGPGAAAGVVDIGPVAAAAVGAGTGPEVVGIDLGAVARVVGIDPEVAIEGIGLVVVGTVPGVDRTEAAAVGTSAIAYLDRAYSWPG